MMGITRIYMEVLQQEINIYDDENRIKIKIDYFIIDN